MGFTIISYSLTGNNNTLAEKLTTRLGAKHIKIKEYKKSTIFRIALSMLFNLIPDTDFDKTTIEENSLIIFIGPIWMGQAAAPLRECFKILKGKIDKYIFVSISGGALGHNPKLESELTKRIGKKPLTVLDMQIADILKKKNGDKTKISTKDTGSYKITPSDLDFFTENAMQVIKQLEKS